MSPRKSGNALLRLLAIALIIAGCQGRPQEVKDEEEKLQGKFFFNPDSSFLPMCRSTTCRPFAVQVDVPKCPSKLGCWAGFNLFQPASRVICCLPNLTRTEPPTETEPEVIAAAEEITTAASTKCPTTTAETTNNEYYYDN